MEETFKFETIDRNIYTNLYQRFNSYKNLNCNCSVTDRCGSNCINRQIFIECSSECRCGNLCENQRFQKHQFAAVSVFRTERKGFGLKADIDIPANTFIIEYIGEVLDRKEWENRMERYSNNSNHYVVELQSNFFIDSTVKGNFSRFLNHSCDPNATMQKWLVAGEPSLGIFSIRHIKAGEEITIDYNFKRYGRRSQKCFCMSAECRGWIG